MCSINLRTIADDLELNKEALVDQIYQTLLDMIYEHRSFLRPNRMRVLAVSEVESLIVFLRTGQTDIIDQFVPGRVKEGLGLSGVLRILDVMREFCREVSSDGYTDIAKSINNYANAYLQAFTRSSESVILEEQERIRAAMQRSLNHNNLWLQTAAEVSRVATSTLNEGKLLSDSMQLIRDYFDFYHVGLFLINEDRDEVILRAASKANNTTGLDIGFSLSIDRETLVGRCILDRRAQIVVDTGTSDFRRDPIILDGTFSIMMLPLTIRGNIIGVIFLQSTQIASFGEDDITRLQTVADQIANAIQNAHLYHELEIYSFGLEQAVEARTAELQKTNEQVEGILNNNPDAILLLTPDGRIESCNTAFYQMFGYTQEEAIGISLQDLVIDDYAQTVADLVHICSKEGQSKWFQAVGQGKNGQTFDAGAALAAIAANGKTKALVCSLRDITEQVQAEDQIKASLREKEVLLREIHHRVKNNMQVISSLLALQAGYTVDAEANQMFRESQNRIRSMALVHELLYQSQDLARIDFVEYVHKLTSHLLYSYLTDPSRVCLDIIADPVYLNVDMAIPCGLIINELITNSLKHAFPNNRQGTIRVELRTERNGLHTIIVRDNGVGIPEQVNVLETETLGLQLVTSLSGQLNATIGMFSNDGTTFEIRFALHDAEQRHSGYENATI